MEGDLDNLANLIFVNEIKPMNSIQIISEFDLTIDLFEALLMLFTKGMKLMYGNNKGVDLELLTDEDYQLFKERFQAIGITPQFYLYHNAQVNSIKGLSPSKQEIMDWKQKSGTFKYETNLPKNYLEDYRQVKSKKIEDYYFQLASQFHYYILNFRLNG